MTKLSLKKIITFLILGILVLGFTGCEWLFEAAIEGLYTTVDGEVVNAKLQSTSDLDYWKSDSDTLVGATISLYKYDEDTGLFEATAKYEDEVDNSGEVHFSEVYVGKYKVDGEKTGWTFVPRVVDIAGDDVNLPNIMAYPDAPDNSFTILLSWQNDDIDLDSYLTFYDGTSTRNKVYYSNPTYNSGLITLDRDITESTSAGIPRIETTTLMVPATSTSEGFFTSSGTTEGIPDYQLRFYVDAYSAASDPSVSLTGMDGTKSSAFAQVDVMYVNTDISFGPLGPLHYGSWEIPWNTAENVLHVLNFETYGGGTSSWGYDVMSAGNIADTSGIKSVTAAE